jgi:hypothetical protein
VHLSNKFIIIGLSTSTIWSIAAGARSVLSRGRSKCLARSCCWKKALWCRTEAINSEIAAGRMVLPDDAPGTGSIRTSAVRSLKAFAKDASVCAIETSLGCSLGPTGAICSKRRRIHICRRPLSTETCVCGSLLCCRSTGAIFGPRSLATTILQAEIHVM